MAQSAQRDEQEVRRFVEHMARMFADWGFPRMAARVIMAMTSADDDAMTAGELAERLGVSPAAISGALRYLIHLGMVVREPIPGSRRDRYRLVDDSWYQVTVTEMTLFKAIVDLAEQGVAAAGGRSSPGGARLAEMRDYFLFVQREMPILLDKWRATKDRRRSSPSRRRRRANVGP
jgi:DNA-binding transcriptional ArsR family regulator